MLTFTYSTFEKTKNTYILARYAMKIVSVRYIAFSMESSCLVLYCMHLYMFDEGNNVLAPENSQWSFCTVQ